MVAGAYESVNSLDPMAIYAETTQWKNRCADLLDALREIKQYSSDPVITGYCDKALHNFSNQRTTARDQEETNAPRNRKDGAIKPSSSATRANRR